MNELGKEIAVGGIRLKSNILMAPLAGYTCFPFRLMAVRLGAGSAYTEMVSADGLKYDDRATARLLYTDDREKLKCVQLLGSVPTVFERAVKSERLEKFDIIDINMGCPVPNVIKAGEGSAPNVAATATVSHPVKQGLIQALGVFTDTLLVCSCTAFIILISGLYDVPELNGIALTQSALGSEIGSAGPTFVALAIFLFAFSSIIGNYYYGEANIRFMTPSKKVLAVYRIFSGGVFVMFGSWPVLRWCGT